MRWLANWIISVKVDAIPVTLNVIQAYAPTSLPTKEKLNAFYGKFCDTINKVPKWKIGSIKRFQCEDRKYKTQRWLARTVVGHWKISERNERWERLPNFCADNDLFISISILATSRPTPVHLAITQWKNKKSNRLCDDQKSIENIYQRKHTMEWIVVLEKFSPNVTHTVYGRKWRS